MGLPVRYTLLESIEESVMNARLRRRFRIDIPWHDGRTLRSADARMA